MAIKFLQSVEVDGEVQGTSLDINGSADISGNVLVGSGTLSNPQSWGKILQVQNTGGNGAGVSIKDSNNEYNLATYAGSFHISDGVDERLTITSSGNATFSGSITGKDSGIIIDSLGGPYGRIHGTSSIFLGGGSTSQVQLSAALIPDGDSTRSLGSGSRYWSHGYIDAITTTGKIQCGGELEGTSLDINGNADISGTLNVTGSVTTTGASVNGNLYANRYLQNATGIPTNNLGAPTVTEMALFEQQFKPQTTLANGYDDLADLTFYKQDTSSSSWTEITSYSDDNKRRFLRTMNSSVIIPNGVYKFRAEFVARSYTFANALSGYWSSQSHRSQVHVWKRRCSDNLWQQHTSSTTEISSWPGHMYLPFGTIAWHETNTSSTGHHNKIRIEFTPNWIAYSGSGTDYSDRDIALYGLQIWGGYPSGKRTVHSYDQYGKLDLFKDLGLPDSGVATFGSSDDLKIYHDGSYSYIEDSGTGNLKIRTNSLNVMNQANSENMLSASQDAAVTLYYNGSEKFETKSDGVDITGELQADSLDIDGNADISGTLSGNFVVRSTNNANTDGANFAVDTTNKSADEYAYEVLRSGTTVAGITMVGKITGTELEGTSLDINGNADISGNLTGVDTLTATTFSGDLNGTINTATTATTQSASNNSTKVATTAYVDTAVTNLIGNAPENLNTLNELAEALNDDDDAIVTINTALSNRYTKTETDAFAVKLTGNQTITGVKNFTGELHWDLSAGEYAGDPRAVAMGYSGGNYGQLGYNIDFTTTSGSHTRVFNDIPTMVTLHNGIVVYASAAGSAGSAISWTEVLEAQTDAFQYKGNNIYYVGNDSGILNSNVTLPTDFVSAANGGTFSGALKITDALNSGSPILDLHNSTNGEGTDIRFTDVSAGTSQFGNITYRHQDSKSYGSAASFAISSGEASTTILADGKLMYNEGIYSKPSSGTGAGTRKDANWDTAYTHSQSAHAPSSATANSSDATLKARANHTGTQAADTISDFDTEVANNSAVAANTAKTSNIVQTSVSGSSGSCTGNAATATTATNVTATSVSNAADYFTCFVSSTGTQGVKVANGLRYNPSTNVLTTGKISSDTVSIVENAKSGAACMTITGAGSGTEANIALKIQGTAHGDPVKLKMKGEDAEGGEVGKGLLSFDPASDTFSIGQSSSHNSMAIKIDNSDVAVFKNMAQFPAGIDITGTTDATNATGDTGILRCEGGASIAKKLYVGSTITGSADVIAFSDKKLKENIETLDGKKVLDMRGVSFTRKDTGAESSGVIAQEIQKVAPELVHDTEGTLGVAYGNLVGYLIEAVKDQQKQIDELKAMINGSSR